MVDLWKTNPIIRFFGEIFFLSLVAAVLVLITGLILGWSTPLQYSNGFFFACVALGAISSSRAVLSRPKLVRKLDDEQPVENKALENLSNIQRIFAKLSLNFRLLMAALVCLAISVLIAQSM